MGAVREVQTQYIEFTLQEECFEELCEALRRDSLPETDPDYAELPKHWSDLMRLYIVPLVSRAALHEFLCLLGFDKLNLKVGDEEAYLAKLQTQINALYGRFKAYLNDNADKFSCYEKPVKNDCLPEPSNWDFDVVSRYPTTGDYRRDRLGPCVDCGYNRCRC